MRSDVWQEKKNNKPLTLRSAGALGGRLDLPPPQWLLTVSTTGGHLSHPRGKTYAKPPQPIVRDSQVSITFAEEGGCVTKKKREKHKKKTRALKKYDEAG